MNLGRHLVKQIMRLLFLKRLESPLEHKITLKAWNRNYGKEGRKERRKEAHHKVGQVTATDEDYPSDCVTYRIGHGDIFYPVEIFWLDPVSGVIELITEPDYESVQQYKLIIEAVDCDLFHPRTASTLVMIDIREENDEAPLCTPLTYRATVLDSTSPGTNINSFRLTCHDRDSADTSMRFEIVSGNGGNHFGFDPIRGSSSPRLIVKSPLTLKIEWTCRPSIILWFTL
uniref:cadherin-related family member 3-like n=1 Tax=Podarcis muralis TaxID=64176 RepID=UPI00109EF96A|nr:cadherin-related family member 3-like [Podarcis muralis]